MMIEIDSHKLARYVAKVKIDCIQDIAVSLYQDVGLDIDQEEYISQMVKALRVPIESDIISEQFNFEDDELLVSLK